MARASQHAALRRGGSRVGGGGMRRRRRPRRTLNATRSPVGFCSVSVHGTFLRSSNLWGPGGQGGRVLCAGPRQQERRAAGEGAAAGRRRPAVQGAGRPALIGTLRRLGSMSGAPPARGGQGRGQGNGQGGGTPWGARPAAGPRPHAVPEPSPELELRGPHDHVVLGGHHRAAAPGPRRPLQVAGGPGRRSQCRGRSPPRHLMHSASSALPQKYEPAALLQPAPLLCAPCWSPCRSLSAGQPAVARRQVGRQPASLPTQPHQRLHRRAPNANSNPSASCATLHTAATARCRRRRSANRPWREMRPACRRSATP